MWAACADPEEEGACLDGDEGRRPDVDYQEEIHLHERRQAAHDVCGRLLTVEILFWKGHNLCDDIRNQYNWEVRVSMLARKIGKAC